MPGPADSAPKVDETIRLLAKGVTQVNACAQAGISCRTWRDWVLRGRHDLDDGRDSAYAALAIRVERAEAEHLGDLEQAITSASKLGDWKAAAWVLSRRQRETYGDKAEIEHKGQVAVRHGVVTKDFTRSIRAGVLGLSEAELRDAEQLEAGKWGLGG